MKHGVLWNSQTGKLTGLARDMFDLNSILKRLLSEEGNKPKPAVYVNCWKVSIFTKNGMDGRMVIFSSITDH